MVPTPGVLSTVIQLFLDPHQLRADLLLEVLQLAEREQVLHHAVQHSRLLRTGGKVPLHLLGGAGKRLARPVQLVHPRGGHRHVPLPMTQLVRSPGQS